MSSKIATPSAMPSQTILQMIEQWEKGCFNAHPNHPESCTACTLALIRNIKAREQENLNLALTSDFVEAHN